MVLSDQITFTPVFDDAMADLAELVRLQADYPNIAVEVGRLIDEGAPLLRANIDWPAAIKARHGIVRYELHERLAACLATCGVKARNINAGIVEGGIHDIRS
jgi:hypothetical protein